MPDQFQIRLLENWQCWFFRVVMDPQFLCLSQNIQFRLVVVVYFRWLILVPILHYFICLDLSKVMGVTTRMSRVYHASEGRYLPV